MHHQIKTLNKMTTMKKQPLTNEQLIEMRKQEIAKHGIGVYSDRRRTIEELLRMRGVNF